eukprot:Nk52_evm3s2438 gene=Nk52_evmTU3s2438
MVGITTATKRRNEEYNRGGDDLDDDLMFDLQGGSDHEKEEVLEDEKEKEEYQHTQQRNVAKKLKTSTSSPPASTASGNGAKKSKKERRKARQEKRREGFMAKDSRVNKLIQSGDMEQQRQLLWEQYVLYLNRQRTDEEKDKEALETRTGEEDIPAACFLDLKGLEERGTEHACGVVKHVCPRWERVLGMNAKANKTSNSKKNAIKMGCPEFLFITNSSVQAADLVKRLNVDFARLCKVVKLFSRHMKIKEQEEYLRNHVVHLAVGTPGRIRALIENGALNTGRLTYVLVDCTRDAKTKNIFQYPESHEELFALFDKAIVPSIKKIRKRLTDNDKLDTYAGPFIGLY